MTADLAMLAAVVAAAGLAAGVLAGLLGVGGGIILVPALDYAFGVVGVADELRMHLAVGTSLASIIPTAIASARAHRLRGAVDRDLARRWAPAPPFYTTCGWGSRTSVPDAPASQSWVRRKRRSISR